ncbi:MAG: hypothetical protein VX278_19835 [Myxococcota bacterium]|nr:hypothetical protein [Myxococcota bacterium]
MKVTSIIIAILILVGGGYAWQNYISPSQEKAAKVDQMKAWKWTAETTAVLYHECHSIDLTKAEDDAEREIMQKRGIRLCDRSRMKMKALTELCENQIPAAISTEATVVDNPEYIETKEQVLKICNMIQEGLKKAEEAKKAEEETQQEDGITRTEIDVPEEAGGQP